MSEKKHVFVLLLVVLVAFASCKGKEDVFVTELSSVETTYRDDRMTRAEPFLTVEIPLNGDDPYAKIIKEKYEELAEYPEAEMSLEDHKFKLYDIDGDGTQELLLSTWYFKWGTIDHEFYINDENYWKDKEGLVLDTFYTIKNGEAEEVVDPMDANWDYFAESMGGREILTNGIIRLCGGSPDYTSYAYYVYKDGVLTFLKALRYYADETRWLITFEGDQSTRTPITEAEFNRMRAEIEGDAQVVEIDWKPLESYGRE